MSKNLFVVVAVVLSGALLFAFQNCGTPMTAKRLQMANLSGDGLPLATVHLINTEGMTPQQVQELKGNCQNKGTAESPEADLVTYSKAPSIEIDCEHYQFVQDLVRPNVASYEFFYHAIKSGALVLTPQGEILALHLSGVENVKSVQAIVPSSVQSLSYVKSGVSSFSLAGGAGLISLKLNGNMIEDLEGLPLPQTIEVLDLTANTIKANSPGLSKLSSFGKGVVNVILKDNMLANVEAITNPQEFYNIQGNGVCASPSTLPDNFDCGQGDVVPPEVVTVKATIDNCIKEYSPATTSPVATCRFVAELPAKKESQLSAMLVLNSTGVCHPLEAVGYTRVVPFYGLPTSGTYSYRVDLYSGLNCTGQKIFTQSFSSAAPTNLPDLAIRQSSLASHNGTTANVTVELQKNDERLTEYKLVILCNSTHTTVASAAATSSKVTLSGSLNVANCSTKSYAIFGLHSLYSAAQQLFPIESIPQAETPTTFSTPITKLSPSTSGKCAVSVEIDVQSLPTGRGVSLSGPSSWNFDIVGCTSSLGKATIATGREINHGESIALTARGNIAICSKDRVYGDTKTSAAVTCNNPVQSTVSNYTASVSLGARDGNGNCKVAASVVNLGANRVLNITTDNFSTHVANGSHGDIGVTLSQGIQKQFYAREKLGTVSSPGTALENPKLIGTLSCVEDNQPSPNLLVSSSVNYVIDEPQCAVFVNPTDLMTNRVVCITWSVSNSAQQYVSGFTASGRQELTRIPEGATVSMTARERTGSVCEGEGVGSYVAPTMTVNPSEQRCVAHPRTFITGNPCRIAKDQNSCQFDFRYEITGITTGFSDVVRSGNVTIGDDILVSCQLENIPSTMSSVQATRDPVVIRPVIHSGSNCQSPMSVYSATFVNAVGICEDGLSFDEDGYCRE